MNEQPDMQETAMEAQPNRVVRQIAVPAPVVQSRSATTQPGVADAGGPTPEAATETKIEIGRLNFFYGRTRALKNISLDIRAAQVTAFIGPSGCGKSTLIRTL